MAGMKVKKQDMTYPTGGGSQPIRIYTPEEAGAGPHPVIVYYHGGGWVIADIDTYEASAMALANKAKAIVISRLPSRAIIPRASSHALEIDNLSTARPSCCFVRGLAEAGGPAQSSRSTLPHRSCAAISAA